MSKTYMITGEKKIEMMKERLKEWNFNDEKIRILASRSHDRMTKEQFDNYIDVLNEYFKEEEK